MDMYYVTSDEIECSFMMQKSAFSFHGYSNETDLLILDEMSLLPILLIEHKILLSYVNFNIC